MINFFAYALLFLFMQKSSNVSDDLSKIKDAYQKIENLSMEVEVMVYRDAYDMTGKLMGKGIMYKLGNLYYSKFMQDEMVSNRNCTLIIDHEEKSITYLDPIPPSKFKLPGDISMDSLMALNDSVVFVREQNGIKQYSFFKGSAVVYRADVYIDSKTFLITKIVYWYSPANEDEDYEMHRAVIVYKNVSTQSVKNTKVFSEKKYIVKKNGKWSPTVAYYGYTVDDVVAEAKNNNNIK